MNTVKTDYSFGKTGGSSYFADYAPCRCDVIDHTCFIPYDLHSNKYKVSKI